QRMAADAKKRETNLLQEGTYVAKILKTFSGYRSDIFGNEETEIGRKIGEDKEKKRIDKAKVVWDGHTASINMATQRAAAGVSIDEQIAAIHRSKGLTSDSKIGPRIPQIQDQHSHQHQILHLHQQGLQQHMSSTQQPIFTGYPFHTTQNVPIPQGLLPVTYSGYVDSSAPFARQLPGFVEPTSPQNVNMAFQQPSQVRPPIPHIPQLHRQSLPGRTMEDE
ncbi:3687_t:CDS:2, partial [Scutellospora calospora]